MIGLPVTIILYKKLVSPGKFESKCLRAEIVWQKIFHKYYGISFVAEFEEKIRKAYIMV